MSRSASAPPQIKGFEYIKTLGSGGFSDVHLYQQELPSRQVAVKVLLADGLSAESQADFVAEANLMAKLSAHPYIVSIHHADVADDGRPFFIMEYCSGASLADQYKKRPLGVPEALRTGIRIASAVATAHQAGVLHRDIKPANILTNEFGWPALTDFGISSAVVDDSIAHTQTRTAVAGGTGDTTSSRTVGMSIPWSPPEMFEDNPAPDVRSDVFSLAATVYTLLAGHTPFEVPGGRNQSLDLMGRIERGALTPLERDDVPVAFLAALKKGMSTRIGDRFDTAIEFGRALQRVELELKLQPTAIEVPNVVVPTPEPGPAPVDESPEDVTRARGVTTVNAQPAKPRVAPAAAGPASEVDDQTVVRGAGTAAAPAEVDESTSAAAPRPKKKRSPVPAIVAVVALAVVGGAGFAVLSGSGEEPEETEPSVTVAPTEPVLGGTVPAPVIETAVRSADGSTLTITWSNPDPVEGDTYVWERTDGAATTSGKALTEEPTATIDGLDAGTTVCISVWIRRDDGGRLSPDPATECVA